LLPRAASRLGAEPDLFELMEREYGCAERDFLTCIDVLESSPQPLRAEDAKRLSSCVIQAYAVMNGRLREEEEIIRELEAEVPELASNLFQREAKEARRHDGNG